MKIHIYAKEGNIVGVAEEIANGVDINCLDKNTSQTPLIYAIASNNLAVVAWLLKKGCEIEATNE